MIDFHSDSFLTLVRSQQLIEKTFNNTVMTMSSRRPPTLNAGQRVVPFSSIDGLLHTNATARQETGEQHEPGQQHQLWTEV